MAYAAGVDVGSTQTKAVIIDESGTIVSRALTETGANVVQAAKNAYERALDDIDLSEREVEYVIGTGYGRYRVTFGNFQVTEISPASVALDIPIDQLGATALGSSKPVRISTTCTVFAESEVLAWLGKGKKIEDILWGVHTSIAVRSAGLLRRVGVEDEVTFTGGVSLNPAMVKALEERLGTSLNVSADSHYMGALGASLFALDHIIASRKPASRSAEVGA